MGPFSDRELDVMAVLWERGSATVGEVLERLEDDLAYTTVLTTLQNMEEKGFVRHEADGRAHRFFPLVDAEDAGASAVRRLIDKVFGGSPERLLTHLVSRRDVSRGDLEGLRDRLDTILSRDTEPEGGAR